MHAPDGFLTAGTAVATGAISTGAVAVALRQTRDRLRDKQIPLAGIAAAFVFAAQMFNFPVAAGTTGHLLGGALAAILLGPWMGALVVTVVVLVQALGFADGPGKARDLIKDGAFAIDGRIPVNTGGGLMAFGHPVGATGVKQAVEICNQLRGRCGDYQVPNQPKVGLAQNMGGDDRTSVVTIFRA